MSEIEGKAATGSGESVRETNEFQTQMKRLAEKRIPKSISPVTCVLRRMRRMTKLSYSPATKEPAS